MIALILIILLGIAFGYFATLNATVVSVHVGAASWEQVPVYLLVLVSIGIGILYASIFYFLKFLSHRRNLGKTSKVLYEAEKENRELVRRVHHLELENTRLKTQYGEPSDDVETLS